MSILVTFADGHSTLVVDRAAADQIVAYWPQAKATIRDLDQEARDREDMLAMMMELVEPPRSTCDRDPACPNCRAHALLKRLGRLP